MCQNYEILSEGCYCNIKKNIFFKIDDWIFIDYKEEDMSLVVKNNISQMTTTTKLAGPYLFHEIFYNQMERCYLQSSIASRIPYLRS